MASPIEATIILCDAAQADPAGKIHMLGAGWSISRSPTTHAVAVLIKIPWDRANQKLDVSLLLYDEDGRLVSRPELGMEKLGMQGQVESGRPPGLKPGTPRDQALVFNVSALVLDVGRYEWRLTVAEATFAATFDVVQSGAG